MKKLAWIGGLAVLGVLAAWWEPTQTVRGRVRGEPFFEGRSASYWAASLIDKNPQNSERAVEALSRGGESAVDVLGMLVTRRDRSPEVRWTAAELLGKSGLQSTRVSQPLLEAFDDPDPHVRVVAAEAVAKVNTTADKAVPALTRLLESQVDVPIIRALSVYRGEAQPALARLRKIMRDPQLPTEVRWNAIRTIGKMGTPGAPAVGELIPLMKDDEPTIREHAAEAVGDIGPEARDAIPALVATLNDSYVKARRDAVRSLGQVGPDAAAALPEIEKLRNDPESIVRDAARKTIETLTGKPAATK